MSYDWLVNDAAFNQYSQSGEDGILEAIYKIICPSNKWCLEVGAADGLLFSNVRRLIEHGWNAVLIESDGASFQRLVENCQPFASQVKCVNAKIDNDIRLDNILQQCGAPFDLDLAVIDVDGQDFYLANQMLRYRPRVVLIEYDNNVDPEFIPTCGGEGQAGKLGINRLMCGKYYHPVADCGTNLLYVKHPLHIALNRTVHKAIAENADV